VVFVSEEQFHRAVRESSLVEHSVPEVCSLVEAVGHCWLSMESAHPPPPRVLHLFVERVLIEEPATLTLMDLAKKSGKLDWSFAGTAQRRNSHPPIPRMHYQDRLCRS